MRILGLLLIVALGVSATVTGQDFTSIDAACYNGTSHIFYFFSGDKYMERKENGVITGPYSMENWKGWKNLGWHKVDAVVYNQDSKTYYFFNGDEYSRKKMGKSLEPPKNIYENWDGYPEGAAVNKGSRVLWRDGASPDAIAYIPSENDYYFFKADKFAVKKYGGTFKQNRLTLTSEDDIMQMYKVRVKGRGLKNIYDPKFETRYRYIFEPNFARNWPSDWRMGKSPCIDNSGMRFPQGCELMLKERVAAAAYNADSNRWYFFVNNSEDGKVEFVTWTFNKHDAERGTVFVNGNPQTF